MQEEQRPQEWHELMRELTVTPLSADDHELVPETLSPGNELGVAESRGDRVLLEARGTAPAQRWRYFASAEEFQRAIMPPGDLPRDGEAPTAPATTAGSPD